ncbi:MAG: glycosyltransferase family 2 protein [Candidatus Nitrospinota bacterium M3_3B_026]
MPPTRRPSVGLVIPAYNEQQALPATLAGIPPGVVDSVVVVDNASSDGTAETARQGGAVVVHEPRRGYGAACLAGIGWYEKNPADIIVFMDADGADAPSMIKGLVTPIADGKADMVIGSRALGQREPGALAPHAAFGNRLAVFLIRLLFGHAYTDLGPFRAVRSGSLASLGMADRDYGWTVEMQVKAIKQGLRIMEIPVPYKRRIGKSKISGTFKGTVMAGWKIITTIFRLRLAP